MNMCNKKLAGTNNFINFIKTGNVYGNSLRPSLKEKIQEH
jgi:hypothetical protein